MKRVLEKQMPAVFDELNDIIIDSLATDTLSMDWNDLRALI